MFSRWTASTGGAVQGSGALILTRWRMQVREMDTALASKGSSTVKDLEDLPPALQEADRPMLGVTSNPTGADIEINGCFVGSTPSIVEVEPGDQEVRISKKGFETWSRTMKVKGGTISLNADLDAVE